MPEYTGTVASPRPQDEVFAYMADFSHVPEWDPNCEAAEQLTPGAIAVGTEFRLTFKAAGQDFDLVYTVTEYDAPRRIVLEGGNDTIRSRDAVTVSNGGAKTEVEYHVDITFTGIRKAFNPALALGMKKAGSDAREGLQQRLG